MKAERFVIFLAAALLWGGGEARAEVRELAGRVVEQWRMVGAEVDQLPTRFLYDDEKATIYLPEPTEERTCTTVAILGARGLSFRARVGGLDEEALAQEPGARASSIAGVLQLERCDRGPIRFVTVASDAGRGAIEIVVGRSAHALPSLRLVLPERTGGAQPQPPEPGALPTLIAPQKRADFAEARAKRDGATLAARETWSAGVDGTGQHALTLEPGCHRIELFALEGKPGPRKARVDLDAELRGEEDELLSRDRTEAPDARLETCVGKPAEGTVLFGGAASGGDVLVTRASWALPEKLPELWGPQPRAKMSRALLARHMRPPQNDPVALLQGGSGLTTTTISVEPGACYVALAAVTHGHSRGIGLRANVGAKQSVDERGPSDDGAAVAFCVGAHDRAALEIEARASSVSWGLALYAVAHRVWSEDP
jgi:hypothetical protein